ncbi:MAG: hypothetical protein RDU89_09380 [bacterium]|nr:hypothetical protein [bacterium]
MKWYWRRSRPPPTGALAAGLFLAATLGAIALVLVLGGQETARRPNAGFYPQLLWEQSVAPGTVGALSPGSLVFLREGSRLRIVDPGGRTVASRDLGRSPVCLLLDGQEADTAFLALSVRPVRSGDPAFGETIQADMAGASWQYALPGAVLVTAAATPDGQLVALSSLHLDRESPEGWLHLLDAEGGVLARLNPEAGAIFRLALSADGTRLAAIDSRALHYLECPQGTLWSRPLPTEPRDLALLSHGGPAALASGALYVYDERGRLLWRRILEAPGVALAVAPGIVAVATREGVTGYHEDGRRAWQWSPGVVPRSLSLSTDGSLLLLVGDDGRAGLYRLAGIE